MRSLRFFAAFVPVAAALVACGSKAGAPTPYDVPLPHGTSPHADAGEAPPPDAGAPEQTTADAGTPPNEQNCTDEMKLVYVVSEAGDLYSFMPATLTFTKIGPLACDAGTAKPTSMAVDRSGMAWVNYTDGTIYKVDTKDASCTKTAFVPGQSGFMKLGMAFVTDDATAKSESLYVVGNEFANGGFVGKGLAKIDTTTLQLKTVGDFSGALAGKGAELTGTGDGRLFGFFTTAPASVAEVDKTSGYVASDKTLDGVDVGDAWAFSFWGGDFWFYTAPNLTKVPGSTSSVTRYKASTDKSIEVVKSDIGFRIVGAGVSTCVPLAQ